MRLDHPQSGKIEQGALFNCLNVPGYEGCPCHGLILTSRCDLEHKKYSVINYLSVVRFIDWAKREMCYLLARRIHKSLQGSIIKALTDNKVTEFEIDTFPLPDIINKSFQGRDREILLKKLENLRLIETVISLGGGYTPQSRELTDIDGKQCDALVRELIQGKLSEYYFLDAVDINNSSADGYVVLLRRMRLLDPEYASAIVAGLEQGRAQSDPGLATLLSFAHEPICMMTGVLRSPDIEHLAQSFANLFVRIGLEDYDDHTIEHHQKSAKR